ncbi:hypothetical protein D1007_00734 [Hordeum vulgare]|nr:hypothetical protein D1007_00734 [Hordeum vulgare]
MPRVPTPVEELRHAAAAKVARMESGSPSTFGTGRVPLDPWKNMLPALPARFSPSVPVARPRLLCYRWWRRVTTSASSGALRSWTTWWPDSGWLRWRTLEVRGRQCRAWRLHRPSRRSSTFQGMLFSVHQFHPEDFPIVFTTAEFRNIAMEAGSVEHQGFELFFRPWLRQAHATARVTRVLVDIMIEGIPSHAWECETTAKILGSSCDIVSLAPETTSREDLLLFKLRAWCRDPDLVPVEKHLWIPELVGEVKLPAARHQACSRLLEYPTLVHIGRMRDFRPPENWCRPPSSDGSDQSGLPDDSGDSFTDGELQVLPWTRGVRDIPGPARAGGDAAGAGVGRSYAHALVGSVGPSNWRLPPMDPSPRPGPAGRAVAVEPPVGILSVRSPPVPVLETVAVMARNPSEELMVVASLEQDQGMGPVVRSGAAPIIEEAEARAVEAATARAGDQMGPAALGKVLGTVIAEDRVGQESPLTDKQVRAVPTVSKDL